MDEDTVLVRIATLERWMRIAWNGAHSCVNVAGHPALTNGLRSIVTEIKEFFDILANETGDATEGEK